MLENAIKYNQQIPAIIIQTHNEAKEFVLQIIDNGIGIKKEDQKRIFEKFYRVGAGDLHPVKGFGLGLSYVHFIVKAHGGKVKVDSRPGKGSTFTLSFPI